MHIDVNGIRVHYELIGPADAPWLVGLHSLATDIGVWDAQVAALKTPPRVRRWAYAARRQRVVGTPYTSTYSCPTS